MNSRLIARFAGGVLVLFAATAFPQAKAAGPELSQIGDNLRFAGQSIQITTRSDGRHAFVLGHIGTKDPINIIVDTGAGVNVIDRGIAEELGLQKVGEMEVLSGGVEPVAANIVVVPLMRVGDLTIQNAEFITLELDAMSLGQFQGVLGMTLFREALLTFDPQNDRITISKGELSAGDPGVVSYHSTLGSGFKIDVEVAGQQITMILDTGSPSSFTFPLALSESLPLQGELRKGPRAQLVGGERSIQLGTLDGVIKLGDLTYMNPELAFMDPSTPYGNIGNSVLGDIVLTIDQRNGLLALRKSEATKVARAATEKQPRKPRRLGIQFRGMPGGRVLTVSKVDSASLGQRAGMKAGDVLVRLNGRPTQEYDMKALGALFRSSTPLRFEVERNGELRIIEIH